MSIDDSARKILEYMRLDMDLQKSDIILGLGTLDTRIAEYSSELMLENFGDFLVFSGGYGKITKNHNTDTEAEIFKKIAINKGVNPNQIIIETKSSNTGENARFTKLLLDDIKIKSDSIIIVTKPYMERRVYATFKKQWSDPNTKFFVTSPKMTYEDHFNFSIPKDLFINIMVGDLHRIKVYPKLGFQIEQTIPKDVIEAFDFLVSKGYNKYLIK